MCRAGWLTILPSGLRSELRGYIAYIRGIAQIVRAKSKFQKDPLGNFRDPDARRRDCDH